MDITDIDTEYYKTVWTTQNDPNILKDEFQNLINDCLRVKEASGSKVPFSDRVMPDVKPDPEDCKRIEVADGEFLHCPFCGHEAQMWQYISGEKYLKGACCSNEDCPMDDPGSGFEAETKREARCLWNKRA